MMEPAPLTGVEDGAKDQARGAWSLGLRCLEAASRGLPVQGPRGNVPTCLHAVHAASTGLVGWSSTMSSFPPHPAERHKSRCKS